MPVALSVVLIAVMIAAITDLRSFTIHNALTLPLLLSGLIYHAIQNGSSGLLTSLGGALFGAGILAILYLLGGIGAGDVKMMAGIGAWLGWPLILTVFVITALAGAAYATILLIAFGRGDRMVVETTVRQSDRRRRLVPYGAMMMVGVVVTTAWWMSGHFDFNMHP